MLILTGLLSVFMPLLEHFCRWDRFLQGGPDMEFGVLGLLLFAGLILLIAHQAAISPFLPLLLAYRLIAFPLRCLLGPNRPRPASGSLAAMSNPSGYGPSMLPVPLLLCSAPLRI